MTVHCYLLCTRTLRSHLSGFACRSRPNPYSSVSQELVITCSVISTAQPRWLGYVYLEETSNLTPKTSETPLESQAQSTRLFTNAVMLILDIRDWPGYRDSACALYEHLK